VSYIIIAYTKVQRHDLLHVIDSAE